MPIEGRIRDFKKEGFIPLGLWICDVSYPEGKVTLSISGNDLLFHFEGKAQGIVSYSLEELCADAYRLLAGVETPKPCSKSRAHGSDTAGRNEPNKNQRGENR